jgi:hypothetical protein
MRRKLLDFKVVLAVVILLVSVLSHVALASNITIDFNGLSGANGSPFTNYTEYGFMVSAVSNNWLVGQNYGNPAPFIYFTTETMETIAVTDGGALFAFSSIDLYASLTKIPYTFTGFLDGNQVFTVSGEVPNTFGNFMTVMNPYSTDSIDTLDVTLTNPSQSNPMGLDNIVVMSQGSTPEPTSLLLFVSGIATLGLSRRRYSVPAEKASVKDLATKQ